MEEAPGWDLISSRVVILCLGHAAREGEGHLAMEGVVVKKDK